MTTTANATYRPLTKAEMRRWLEGANFGAVVAGAHLRLHVEGMQDATDGLYLRATQ